MLHQAKVIYYTNRRNFRLIMLSVVFVFNVTRLRCFVKVLNAQSSLSTKAECRKIVYQLIVCSYGRSHNSIASVFSLTLCFKGDPSQGHRPIQAMSFFIAIACLCLTHLATKVTNECLVVGSSYFNHYYLCMFSNYWYYLLYYMYEISERIIIIFINGFVCSLWWQKL